MIFLILVPTQETTAKGTQATTYVPTYQGTFSTSSVGVNMNSSMCTFQYMC